MIFDKEILKCTRGSSYNVIVSDKETMEKTRRKFYKWCKNNYYHVMRERPHKFIPLRIICDQFLCPADSLALNEVELYCKNGQVRFIVNNHEKNGKRRGR